MHAILMLFYAVGVVLFGAALAHALVCWIIDRIAALSALLRGKGPAEPYAAPNLRLTVA
jgi:hypothetical protein